MPEFFLDDDGNWIEPEETPEEPKTVELLEETKPVLVAEFRFGPEMVRSLLQDAVKPMVGMLPPPGLSALTPVPFAFVMEDHRVHTGGSLDCVQGWCSTRFFPRRCACGGIVHAEEAKGPRSWVECDRCHRQEDLTPEQVAKLRQAHATDINQGDQETFVQETCARVSERAQREFDWNADHGEAERGPEVQEPTRKRGRRMGEVFD